MTISVTLKAVKEEIEKDNDLKNAPVVMKREAILRFVDLIKDHPDYTITTRSEDAIIKYAHGLVKGEER